MLVYVCMYMYACIYIYMYVYVCVYVCVYMYVCMYVCMCMCVYAYMCMYAYVCMYVCITYWGELSGGMSYPKRKGELSGGNCPEGIVLGGIVLHPGKEQHCGLNYYSNKNKPVRKIPLDVAKGTIVSANNRSRLIWVNNIPRTTK